MSEHEAKALEVYFVALYVYEPAEIELEFSQQLEVRSLGFDKDRFFTGPKVVITPPSWRIEQPGVYGWWHTEFIPFRVVSGTVIATMKQGIGAGKDPWPPPPPPPPPFASNLRAVKRWAVHTCAHHERCELGDSELFLAALA